MMSFWIDRGGFDRIDANLQKEVYLTRFDSVYSISTQLMMLCTSSSSDRDLCSITRESANEFCWVFYGCFIRLVVFWLSYAKVSDIIFENFRYI